MVKTEREIPTNGDKNNTIVPPIKDTVPHQSTFPIEIEVLETGATNISFKKPNSLSITKDIPLPIEGISKVIPIIPGYINFKKSILPAIGKEEDIPLPMKNKNMSGWITIPIILDFCLANLLTSRIQSV